MVNVVTHRTVLLVVLLGLVLTLSACGGEPSSPYTVVTAAKLTSDNAIPLPREEVILTISGDITKKNMEDTLLLDMPTLESFGLVEYAINDPWEGRTVKYTGVLMSDLIKVIGVSQSATSFHMVALDDYEVDISLVDIKRWPILLATRSDGEYLTIEKAGPTRIIFPFDTYPEIDQLTYKILSIWSIESMELR